jgi:hypothetical protein
LVRSLEFDPPIIRGKTYDINSRNTSRLIIFYFCLGFVLSLHLKGGPIVFSVDNIVDFSGVNPMVKINSNYSTMDLLEVE